MAAGRGHRSVERGGYSVSSPLHETALEILSLTRQVCCGANQELELEYGLEHIVALSGLHGS